MKFPFFPFFLFVIGAESTAGTPAFSSFLSFGIAPIPFLYHGVLFGSGGFSLLWRHRMIPISGRKGLSLCFPFRRHNLNAVGLVSF